MKMPNEIKVSERHEWNTECMGSVKVESNEPTVSRMTPDDFELWQALCQVANERSDGHLTIMKFTGNWRVAFMSPSDRDDIGSMSVGETFGEAARKALDKAQSKIHPKITGRSPN
jgi:hypothetical protein